MLSEIFLQYCYCGKFRNITENFDFLKIFSVRLQLRSPFMICIVFKIGKSRKSL